MDKRIIAMTLATLLASPVLAAPTADERTALGEKVDLQVDVSGQGEVQAQPDIALISASLVQQGPQSEALLKSISGKMQQVIKALKQQGVAAEDIQAGQVRIHQRWNRTQNGNEPQGYEAQRPLTVTVRAIEAYPGILDAMAGAGINTINNVSFEFSDHQGLGDQALQLATEDAKRKALLLGKSLGAADCRPTHITLGARHVPMPRMEMAAMKVADQAYNPGNQVIRGEVSATFRCR